LSHQAPLICFYSVFANEQFDYTTVYAVMQVVFMHNRRGVADTILLAEALQLEKQKESQTPLVEGIAYHGSPLVKGVD